MTGQVVARPRGVVLAAITCNGTRHFLFVPAPPAVVRDFGTSARLLLLKRETSV